MPFLNRIQMWADRRPDDTAIAVGGRGFSWSELRGAAAELVPSTPETYILTEPNTPEFAALYCAGIAGERQIAVLDPQWTPQAREEIIRRLPSPSWGAGTTLEDGHPDSTFLIGFTSGTTTARNVTIDINPMIERSKHFEDRELAQLPGFLNGFSALPPGREMRWSLGSHTDIFDQGALRRHTVTISLEGPFGPVEPYSYVLDYDDMKESALRDPGHIGQVAKELKEIKKTFEKGVGIVQGMAREQ